MGNSWVRETTSSFLQGIVSKNLRFHRFCDIVFTDSWAFLGLIYNPLEVSRDFTFGNEKLSSFGNISSNIINRPWNELLLLLQHRDIVSGRLSWCLLCNWEYCGLVEMCVEWAIIISCYSPLVISLFWALDHVVDGHFPGALRQGLTVSQLVLCLCPNVEACVSRLPHIRWGSWRSVRWTAIGLLATWRGSCVRKLG